MSRKSALSIVGSAWRTRSQTPPFVEEFDGKVVQIDLDHTDSVIALELRGDPVAHAVDVEGPGRRKVVNEEGNFLGEALHPQEPVATQHVIYVLLFVSEVSLGCSHRCTWLPEDVNGVTIGKNRRSLGVRRSRTSMTRPEITAGMMWLASVYRPASRSIRNNVCRSFCRVDDFRPSSSGVPQALTGDEPVKVLDVERRPHQEESLAQHLFGKVADQRVAAASRGPHQVMLLRRTALDKQFDLIIAERSEPLNGLAGDPVER